MREPNIVELWKQFEGEIHITTGPISDKFGQPLDKLSVFRLFCEWRTTKAYEKAAQTQEQLLFLKMGQNMLLEQTDE